MVPYDYKTDYWSFGLILYVSLVGQKELRDLEPTTNNDPGPGPSPIMPLPLSKLFIQKFKKGSLTYHRTVFH